MVIYKFLPTCYALDVIRNGLLKLTTYAEFNDPYEFKGLRFSQLKESEKQPGSLLEEYVFGCFSMDFKNPTMWSHYADSHKGMALGFEVDDEELGKNLFKVEYKTEIEIIDDYVSSNTGKEIDLLINLIKIKSNDWKYENEIRTFYHADECKILSISGVNKFFLDCKKNNLKLSEIIIGINSQISYGELIDLISNQNELIFSQAKLSKSRFEIEKSLIDAPLSINRI